MDLSEQGMLDIGCSFIYFSCEIFVKNKNKVEAAKRAISSESQKL